MSKAVLVDIDDTISNTQSRIIQYVNLHSSTSYTYDALTREFREGNNPDYDKYVKEFLASPGEVARCEPFPHSKAALSKLASAGYEIHIASARKENLHETTAQWLEDNGLMQYVHTIHTRYGHTPGSAFKVNASLSNNVVAAFDDTYDVAEALANHGVKVYLITHPWNSGQPEHFRITPTINFAEAVDIFLIESSK